MADDLDSNLWEQIWNQPAVRQKRAIREERRALDEAEAFKFLSGLVKNPETAAAISQNGEMLNNFGLRGQALKFAADAIANSAQGQATRTSAKLVQAGGTQAGLEQRLSQRGLPPEAVQALVQQGSATEGAGAFAGLAPTAAELEQMEQFRATPWDIRAPLMGMGPEDTARLLSEEMRLQGTDRSASARELSAKLGLRGQEAMAAASRYGSDVDNVRPMKLPSGQVVWGQVVPGTNEVRPYLVDGQMVGAYSPVSQPQAQIKQTGDTLSVVDPVEGTSRQVLDEQGRPTRGKAANGSVLTVGPDGTTFGPAGTQARNKAEEAMRESAKTLKVIDQIRPLVTTETTDPFARARRIQQNVESWLTPPKQAELRTDAQATISRFGATAEDKAKLAARFNPDLPKFELLKRSIILQDIKSSQSDGRISDADFEIASKVWNPTFSGEQDMNSLLDGLEQRLVEGVDVDAATLGEGAARFERLFSGSKYFKGWNAKPPSQPNTVKLSSGKVVTLLPPRKATK